MVSVFLLIDFRQKRLSIVAEGKALAAFRMRNARSRRKMRVILLPDFHIGVVFAATVFIFTVAEPRQVGRTSASVITAWLSPGSVSGESAMRVRCPEGTLGTRTFPNMSD